MRLSDYAAAVMRDKAEIFPPAPARLQDIVFVKTHASILVEQIEKLPSVISKEDYKDAVSKIEIWKSHELLMIREAVVSAADEIRRLADECGDVLAADAARDLLVKMRTHDRAPELIAKIQSII